MSNFELLDEINKIGICQGKLNAYLKKHYPDMFNEFVSRTHFLDDFYKDKSVPIPARLYCLKHNLKEQPRCQNPNCPTHAIVEWCRGTKSFRQYCSVSCHNSDPNFMDKIVESNMKRHGVKCTLQLESVKEKSRETNIKNLGVPYPM